MSNSTQFKSGVSGNQGAKWKPGQSGNPAGKSKLRLRFEETFNEALITVAQAWHVLEPATPFIKGLHVEAICQHLQAVTEGRIGNLIINVPPGHAKSLLTAVFWPAWWVWIDHPQTGWLFASYCANLSVRDSLKCRRLIESDWYRQRWDHRYQLTSDQNQKHRFENDHTSYRIATSVGGSATGERADVVVVDDPHSVADAERRTAVEWFNGTMSTRPERFHPRAPGGDSATPARSRSHR